MKYKYINYIIGEYSKCYPNSSTEKLENVLLQSSIEDLYRLANMIDRFGIEALMGSIND